MQRLIIGLILVVVLLSGCNDWDGMDRSSWPATATASVPAEATTMATVEP